MVVWEMDIWEEDKLNVAILSGKGGTGKTTVSTNLALALKANYIDCDVEEPNGFLFLNPNIEKTKDVLVEYPFIDDSKCNSCGKCTKTCQFNSLASVGEDIILFQKLCHSCGACEIVCPNDAISYKKRAIGQIELGKSEDINCIRGILNVSEPMAVPVIKEIFKNIKKSFNVIDCPPGTSCNVVNALKYADSAILVTEPSEFGLHDMKMALEVVKLFNIPFGVVINKDDEKENIIRKYCTENKIKVIGSIPYSREVASIYSKGEILYKNKNYKTIFDDIALNTKEVLSWN